MERAERLARDSSGLAQGSSSGLDAGAKQGHFAEVGGVLAHASLSPHHQSQEVQSESELAKTQPNPCIQRPNAVNV